MPNTLGVILILALLALLHAGFQSCDALTPPKARQRATLLLVAGFLCTAAILAWGNQ